VVHLPASRPLQRINISGERTFQQPSKEPMGEDWEAELAQLMAVPKSFTHGIRRAQSNADPCVAAARQLLATAERGLPEGEGREAVLRFFSEGQRMMEHLLEEAQLPTTKTRAGKQQRRRNGRTESQHKVTALFPARRNVRGRAPLVQQVEGQAADRSDPLPTLGKKGKAVNKVGDRLRCKLHVCTPYKHHDYRVHTLTCNVGLHTGAWSHRARQRGRHLRAQRRRPQPPPQAAARPGGGSMTAAQRPSAAYWVVLCTSSSAGSRGMASPAQREGSRRGGSRRNARARLFEVNCLSSPLLSPLYTPT